MININPVTVFTLIGLLALPSTILALGAPGERNAVGQPLNGTIAPRDLGAKFSSPYLGRSNSTSALNPYGNSNRLPEPSSINPGSSSSYMPSATVRNAPL